MREILRSAKLPGPQFKYSPCVKVGPIYQFAGMIALEVGSDSICGDGPRSETATILKNLKNALPDFGLSLTDLYSARLYTTEFDKFNLINEAWNEFFIDVDPPARAAVGVCALPLGATVEIEFSFYKES